tara:strand:- start:189 stop:302 length:114 start_codon:yes stop_codon:yes gene_type:complete
MDIILTQKKHKFAIGIKKKKYALKDLVLILKIKIFVI